MVSTHGATWSVSAGTEFENGPARVFCLGHGPVGRPSIAWLGLMGFVEMAGKSIRDGTDRVALVPGGGLWGRLNN